MNGMHVARFTVAYWCVLVAALLPLVCSVLAKRGGTSADKVGRFTNHDPRGWLAKQRGWRARANAAQANSFEALPFFIGAVIIAHQLGAHQTWLDLLALLFILLRAFYIGLYLGDMPLARSAVWGAGFLTTVAILFLGYR